MKAKTAKYTDDNGEIRGNLRRVKDFLPLPSDLPTLAELAGEKSQTKITLAVDDDALAFFKAEARKRNTSYQRMMRKLISAYARKAGALR